MNLLPSSSSSSLGLRQQQLKSDQPLGSKLIDFQNSVKELQRDINQCKQLIEREEQLSMEKYKSLCFKWVRFEKELNIQVEEINTRFIGSKLKK